jgi:5'-nucleotidase
VRISILSTNDLHGQLDPLVRYTSDTSPRPYRVGGAEALAATIAELRATNPEGTVLVDAGDFIQGSLLSNHFEGAPVAAFFETLGYDAVTIGNHEFDFGPAGNRDAPPGPGTDPLGALKAWCRLGPPVLSANIARSDGQTIRWPGVRSHEVVTRNGVRLGLIGVTTPETAVTTMPALVQGLRFGALAATVAAEARALRSRRVAVIVVLAHADGECRGQGPGTCTGEIFEDLIDRLPLGLVDVVVAGHSHQAIAQRFKNVYVVEACSRGLAVGQVELVVDRDRGRVLLDRSRALAPTRVCHDVFERTMSCGERDGGRIVRNPLLAKHEDLVRRVNTALDRYRIEIRAKAERVLARAAKTVRHHRSELSETGTLFARALLEAVPGADFAVLQPGGVRADLPAGDIRYGDLFDAFPFENHLATVRVSGTQLKAILAHLVARGRGIPLVAGLKVRLRCGPPQEIASLADGEGRPLDGDRLYTVVLNDFLVKGGDGLGPLLDTVLPANKHTYADLLVREEIAKFLLRAKSPLNGPDNPVMPADDPPVSFEEGPCAKARPRVSSPCGD